MTNRTVRYNPLTLKIGQPLFGTTKRSALRELSHEPSDVFNHMYQYHLQAAKVVDYCLHVNNKRRADETEAEDQEQYLTHYEPLIIEKWALRLLKTDKSRTIISTESIARIDVEDAGCEICCDPGAREEHTEQGDLPTTDMYQCSICNRTYHWSCLEKTTQAVKTTPHFNKGKRATLVPSTV